MFGNAIMARLGLDTGQFKAGLKTAQADAAAFGKNLGFALGTLVSGAAIRDVIEYGDKIQDLSDRYSVNAESLQRLGNVAEKEGSSLDSVAKAFNRLTINTSAALGGNKDAIKHFEALGISLEDLGSMKPEAVFQKIGAGAMTADDFVKILGKSALDLRPTLEGLAKGTIHFGDAIDALHIKKLSEASDALKELKEDAMIALAPLLTTVGDGFHVLANDARNAAETTKGMWSYAFDAIALAAQGKFAEASAASEKSVEMQKQALADLFFYRENLAGKAAAAEAGLGAAGGATATGSASAPSKAELADEQKQRERVQFSLSDLAERPKTFSNDQSIQAWYAGEQARKVQELEGKARGQAVEDPEGAKRTLEMADEIRQSIAGLKESERDPFKTALFGTEQRLDKLIENTSDLSFASE